MAWGDKPISNEEMMQLTIEGNADKLYQQLPDSAITDNVITSLESKTIARLYMLPVWNRIFRDLPRLKINPSVFIDNRLDANSKLLIDIWNFYGRRQFEDSLLYISDKFGYHWRENDRFFNAIIREDALGLLAYLYGHRLISVPPDSPVVLAPLTEPGLLSYSDNSLSAYWKYNLGYKTSGHPERVAVFTALMEIRNIEF